MEAVLTEAQLAAATAPVNAPVMILAAAGSGKTLVLCHRILHLIAQGVRPKEILAVTFTRRAGQDLKGRLKLLCNSKELVNGVRIGTFHSLCLSILRAFPTEAGLSPDFVVFTPKMQIELLEELVKEWYTLKSDRKLQENVSRGLFRSEAYRVLKQLGCLAERDQIENKLKEDSPLKWIFEQYCLHLQRLNAVDFGSFIRYTNNLLESSAGALETLGMKFEHVLVDEFQDTDTDQFKLLQALCSRHQHLTVVGDDDQQIYSWRGAAGLRNFSMLSAAFASCRVHKLEQNFRSTGGIIAAARCVIGRNKSRIQKTIRTLAATGNLVTTCECRNEQCEASAVADHIFSLKAKGVAFHEMAVLYRLHRVGTELQHKLQARGVPCEMKSGYGTGDDGVSSEISKVTRSTGEAFADVISVLRLIHNESDDYSCKRLLRLLCPEAVPIFANVQEESGGSIFQGLKVLRSYLLGVSPAQEELSSFHWLEVISSSTAPGKVADAVQAILKIVAATREDLQKLTMKDVVMNLLQQISPYRNGTGVRLQAADSSKFSFSGIKALLKEAALFDSDEATPTDMTTGRSQCGSKQMSYKDMRKHQKREPGSSTRLIKSHGKYMERLRSFLDRVAVKLHDYELGESTEHASRQQQADVVTLSTIHQAKGLEWISVTLVRANEGVLPVTDYNAENNSEAALQRQEEAVEEERRLMYVAMTRAKRWLFITHLMTDGGQPAFPSRFLADIPKGLTVKRTWYDSNVQKAGSQAEHQSQKTSVKARWPSKRAKLLPPDPHFET